MDATRRIVKWACFGGIALFVVDWFISGGETMSVRVTLGLMCAGGGFVTAGLLAAVFAGDSKERQSWQPGRSSLR